MANLHYNNGQYSNQYTQSYQHPRNGWGGRMMNNPPNFPHHTQHAAQWNNGVGRNGWANNSQNRWPSSHQQAVQPQQSTRTSSTFNHQMQGTSAPVARPSAQPTKRPRLAFKHNEIPFVTSNSALKGVKLNNSYQHPSSPSSPVYEKVLNDNPATPVDAKRSRSTYAYQAPSADPRLPKKARQELGNTNISQKDTSTSSYTYQQYSSAGTSSTSQTNGTMSSNAPSVTPNVDLAGAQSLLDAISAFKRGVSCGSALTDAFLESVAKGRRQLNEILPQAPQQQLVQPSQPALAPLTTQAVQTIPVQTMPVQTQVSQTQAAAPVSTLGTIITPSFDYGDEPADDKSKRILQELQAVMNGSMPGPSLTHSSSTDTNQLSTQTTQPQPAAEVVQPLSYTTHHVNRNRWMGVFNSEERERIEKLARTDLRMREMVPWLEVCHTFSEFVQNNMVELLYDILRDINNLDKRKNAKFRVADFAEVEEKFIRALYKALDQLPLGHQSHLKKLIEVFPQRLHLRTTKRVIMYDSNVEKSARKPVPMFIPRENGQCVSCSSSKDVIECNWCRKYYCRSCLNGENRPPCLECKRSMTVLDKVLVEQSITFQEGLDRMKRTFKVRDSEIQEVSTDLKLYDLFTYKRIDIPVKGRLCLHRGVFDLATFLRRKGKNRYAEILQLIGGTDHHLLVLWCIINEFESRGAINLVPVSVLTRLIFPSNVSLCKFIVFIFSGQYSYSS